MRLHVLSLPHTQTTDEYLSCAYTQKVVKFSKMMVEHGHEVYLYSGDQNDAICTEHIPLITERERAGWFGKGFDTVTDPLRWDPNEPYWVAQNGRAIAAIRPRMESGDVLCIIGGNCQKQTSDMIPELTAVEWGVGYEGVYTSFRAFESYAWMHHVYGLQRTVNGNWYDVVIPNFFDPDQFRAAEPDDYLLYVGRVTQRKGPHVAAQIAERTGRRLIVAGPGVEQVLYGKGREKGTTTIIGDQVQLRGRNLEYVGEVGVEERAELMSKAAAVLVPTIYIEPFGGVAVEAMMSGAPVITPDYGAFTETVQQGVTGFRFHTLPEGAKAVQTAVDLDREAIREYALGRYSLDAVAPQFEEWLGRVTSLRHENWDGTPLRG